MSTRRTTERGAIAGFLTGTTVALLHLAATSLGWLHYGSVMNANFHVAIYAFSSAVVVGWLASSPRSGELSPSAPRLVFHWRSAFREDATPAPLDSLGDSFVCLPNPELDLAVSKPSKGARRASAPPDSSWRVIAEYQFEQNQVWKGAKARCHENTNHPATTNVYVYIYLPTTNASSGRTQGISLDPAELCASLKIGRNSNSSLAAQRACRRERPGWANKPMGLCRPIRQTGLPAIGDWRQDRGLLVRRLR